MIFLHQASVNKQYARTSSSVLLPAHCSQLSAYFSLLTAYCLLLTAHCSRFTTHSLLLTTYYSLLGAVPYVFRADMASLRVTSTDGGVTQHFVDANRIDVAWSVAEQAPPCGCRAVSLLLCLHSFCTYTSLLTLHYLHLVNYTLIVRLRCLHSVCAYTPFTFQRIPLHVLPRPSAGAHCRLGAFETPSASLRILE